MVNERHTIGVSDTKKIKVESGKWGNSLSKKVIVKLRSTLKIKSTHRKKNSGYLMYDHDLLMYLLCICIYRVMLRKIKTKRFFLKVQK